MNRTHVLRIAALALSAAASSSVFAQTISAEEWVGSPIHFTSTQSRAEVTAGYFASPSRAPQELRVGPADAGPGAMDRATVAADRNLWLRAGLASYGEYAEMDPQYSKRMANYMRMRSGPEFTAELNRIEGARSRSTAMIAAPASAQ
ncbi:MAG: hypothetical protein JSS14_17780 [Proteobacteria bacterium]|nr:hypothetical protein [Pseudomonadota bacterium]